MRPQGAHPQPNVIPIPVGSTALYGHPSLYPLEAARNQSAAGAQRKVAWRERLTARDLADVGLRSLVPLDTETILHWTKQTGRVTIAHEGPEFAGFGGEVAAFIAKEGFEYLDAPIQRVGAKYSPVPFSTALEPEVLPQPKHIVTEIQAAAIF